MTGGPNNWAAQVTYPRMQAQNTYVFYNYRDTVNVEWTSWAQNSTQTTMQIWWWDPSLEGQQWQPLQLDVVPQNGTKSYKLNNVKNNGYGWYLGQWNLNFTRADQNPPTGLTLSQAFNCSFDDSVKPQTYGSSGTKTASVSTGSALPTPTGMTTSASFSTAAPTGTTNPSSNAAAASASATSTAAASSGISGGAVAGVVIGVLAAIGLAAAGGFFLWRRNRAAKAAAAAAAASAADGGAAGPAGPPGGGASYAHHPAVPPTPGTVHSMSVVSPVTPGGQPYPYGAAAGAPAVYGAPGSDYKQAVVQTQHEYYNKAMPPIPPMAQSQHQQMYSELPGHQPGSYPPPSQMNEMQGSQPIRQELPG